MRRTVRWLTAATAAALAVNFAHPTLAGGAVSLGVMTIFFMVMLLDLQRTRRRSRAVLLHYTQRAEAAAADIRQDIQRVRGE